MNEKNGKTDKKLTSTFVLHIMYERKASYIKMNVQIQEKH